jgi:hypothetical protein
MKAPRYLSAGVLPLFLASCYLMPYPDHHLTRKDAAWGKVKRGEPYVLLKDLKPYPDYAALRDSSCAGVDDVGILKKGTTVKFTGFCVRRYYWGPQPFVYGEVMSGEFTGKTFDADALVQTASTFKGRKAWMVDVNHQAVRPLLAGTAAAAPVKTD